MNVLIHSLNGILRFLVLRALTGFRWESAVVALLFSIHPLHVESVAWVSERKDVLCGLFWILTIGAYTGYVRKPRSFGLYAVLHTCIWRRIALETDGRYSPLCLASAGLLATEAPG